MNGMNNGPENREYEDVGETVAEMNVEGMPWYTPSDKKNGEPGKELTDEGVKAFTLGTMTAGILVTIVFAAVFLAFILLLTKL